jgi:hypothetical protein
VSGFVVETRKQDRMIYKILIKVLEKLNKKLYVNF